MPRKKKVVQEEVQENALTEQMIEEIKNETAELLNELDKSMRFAAAAKRARKHTTNLQKMYKEYRAASVAHWKNV